ncbi:MAG: putative peptide maturation dehydrogenase [Chloroflexota bacterium]
MPGSIRRTAHLFIYLHDGHVLDVDAVLRGVAQVAPRQEIYVISMLDGTEYLITAEEMQRLFSIPSDRWIAAQEASMPPGGGAEVLDRFTRSGIVLCDLPGEPFEAFRRRDEALSVTDWNVYAALYHAMKRWRDLDLDKTRPQVATLGQMADRFKASHGRIPPHFHSVRGDLGVRSLPLVEKDGDLYRALLARRTTRSFDPDTPLNPAALATVLYYVFGCQGYDVFNDDIWLLRKSSPSGGGLHPIEVYPLIRHVQGVGPGLYHYNVEHHELEMMAAKSERDVAEMAGLFAAGQSYARDSQVLLVLTARFPRNFWKYRTHEKAYSVIIMDAGHLSQTLYLVCADLGLGAFVTAAINDANIEEALGIDGFSEGVLAVLGIGHPSGGRSALEPVFHPYSPR